MTLATTQPARETPPDPPRPGRRRAGYLPRAVVACLTALAVPPAAAGPEASPPAASPIEQAHGAEAWRGQRAVRADLVLTMGGRRVLEGRLLAETTGGRSRLELADGTVALFDGREARVWPAASAFKSARFHLLTWPYFLALPMKLTDPGTHLESESPREFDGAPCDVQRLTFDDGTGDTPRDWYLVFSDRADHRVRGAAYAMTFGQGANAARPERPENAIRYDRFVTVSGVTLPTLWRFHDWLPEGKLSEATNGTVELANLAFVTPAEGAFTAPPDSRVEP